MCKNIILHTFVLEHGITQFAGRPGERASQHAPYPSTDLPSSCTTLT